MKKLRKIYYPILIALLIMLVVFSALSVKANFSTTFISTELAKTNTEKIASVGNYDASDDNSSVSSNEDRGKVVAQINKIINGAIYKKYKATYDNGGTNITLTTGSNSSVSKILMGQYVGLDEDGKEVKKYELAPSYYSSTVTVKQDDIDAIDNAKDKGLLKGMIFQTIALYIPGSKTKSGFSKTTPEGSYSFEYDESKLADVVMMVAHYDSDLGDNGYTNNALSIGTMLSLFDEIVNGGKTYKNDILMVFTDYSYTNGLGLEMFMKSSSYSSLFSSARDRVKSVLLFDNVGDVTTVIASQAKGSDTVSVFATSGGWYHSGSFSGNIASSQIGNKEFSALSGVSAIEILGVGKKSQITTSATITNSNLSRVASVIGNLADRFGNAELTSINSDAVVGFYSYLGLKFYFASYVSYIIGALVLALAGVIAWFVIKKNALNPKKTGLGVAVSILSILATVLTLTVLYLLLVLLLSLVGKVSVFAIGTIVTDNVIFFILASAVSVILLALYNSIFKNVFSVKALDVVRGNAWFVIFLASLACFIFPTYSYLFAGLAIAQGATMLCSILLKDKFKNKFGFDIERLLLYGAFAIILMPIVFAETLVVYSVSPAIFLPLILSLVLVYAQSFAPYLLIIKDLLGSTKSNKSVREEKVANNGKSKTLVSRKAVTAVSVCVVFTYLISLLCAVLSASSNGLTATMSRFYGNDAIYNNAFVYKYDDINGATSQSILLKDLDLYEYMKNNLGDFEWSAKDNAYKILDDTPATKLPVESTDYKPYYIANGSKIFRFSKDTASNDIRLGYKPSMTITFKTLKGGDKINYVRLINSVGVMTTTESQSANKYQEYKVDGNQITITVPSGYGSDLGIEVFASSKNPAVELGVEVKLAYSVGTLDKMGDLASVQKYNEVISTLSSKYSTDDIINNVYFVFEYNYKGKVNVVSSNN